MFGILKKKISGFVDKLTKKEEEKGEPERAAGSKPDSEEAKEVKPGNSDPAELEVTDSTKDKALEGEASFQESHQAPTRDADFEKSAGKLSKEEKDIEASGLEQTEAEAKVPEAPKDSVETEGQSVTEKTSQPEMPSPKHEKISKEQSPKPKETARKEPPAKLGTISEKQPSSTPEIEQKQSKPEKPQEPVSYKTEKEQITERIEPEQKPNIRTPQETPEKLPESVHEISEKKKPLRTKPEKARERVKLSPFSMIKSFIKSEVEISEGDISDMLDELELELLEGDVDMEVAEFIKQDLHDRLIGQKVKKKELDDFIRGVITETLTTVMSAGEKFDFLTKTGNSDEPTKIMFLGVNGSGKTTTIAKVAHLLLANRKKVVFAAGDTFRAAAIEQMGVHAKRLGVKMVKRDYGADPASVAYDAVNYARAHSIDAVLIDTAGRQDTNVNLLNELKKMERVIKPDLKIFIGESVAGNAIIDQLTSFNKEIGVDGVILTKLDCDPKGGTMLSIGKSTGIPIIYIGTGQEYDDLRPFDAKEMAERIAGEE
jgi:fused signal recognition particle receptor